MLSTCWLTTPFSGCFNTAMKGGVGLHDSGDKGPFGRMSQNKIQRRAPRLSDRSRSEGWPMSQDDDKFFPLESTSAFSVFGNDHVLLGARKHQPPPPATEKSLANGIAGGGGLPPAGLSSERSRGGGGVVTTIAPKSQNQILPSLDYHHHEKAHQVRHQEQPSTPRKSKSMGRIHGTNPAVVGSGGTIEVGGGGGGGKVEQQPLDNKKEGETQAPEPVFRGHRRVPSDGVAWRHSKALEKEQLGMDEDDKFFKRTYKSEYRKKFRPFSQYQYVDGKFHKSKIEAEPAAAAGNTWYKEVLELRKQAGQYRCRGWGVETASDRMAEIYNKQVELWEQVSRRSSLQALSLASVTAPSRPISKAEKEIENSRRSSPIKHTGRDRPHTAPSKHKPAPVHSNKMVEKSEKVEKVDKVDGKSSKETTPRHHYDRTTGGDGLLITSPSRDGIEPIVSIDWSAARRSSRKTPPLASPIKDAAAKRRPPRAISIARTSTPKEIIKENKTHKSTSMTGRSVSAGPENRSPKRTSRPPSSHTQTPAVKPERRPRPTSLSTSSRRKGTDSAIPHHEAKKPSKKSHDISASPKRSADLKNREEKRQSDEDSKKDYKEKDGKDIFRESLKDGRKSTPEPRFDPEKYEPVVKTPPEPTRVKSPDQVMVKSPDPVNWTVPLDTGKTFTVTHNIPEGESSRGTPSSEHRPPLEPRSRQTPEPTRIYQGSLAGTPITTAGTTPSATTATASSTSSTVPQEKIHQASKPDSGSATMASSMVGATTSNISSQSAKVEEKLKDPVSGVPSSSVPSLLATDEKEIKNNASEKNNDNTINKQLDSKLISSENEPLNTSVESSKTYQGMPNVSEVKGGQVSSSSVSPNPPTGFSSGILSVVGSNYCSIGNILETNLEAESEIFDGKNVAEEYEVADNISENVNFKFTKIEDIQVFRAANNRATFPVYVKELLDVESEELKFENEDSDTETETKNYPPDFYHEIVNSETDFRRNIPSHEVNINFIDDKTFLVQNISNEIKVHKQELSNHTNKIDSEENFNISGDDDDHTSIEGSYEVNSASLESHSEQMPSNENVKMQSYRIMSKGSDEEYLTEFRLDSDITNSHLPDAEVIEYEVKDGEMEDKEIESDRCNLATEFINNNFVLNLESKHFEVELEHTASDQQYSNKYITNESISSSVTNMNKSETKQQQSTDYEHVFLDKNDKANILCREFARNTLKESECNIRANDDFQYCDFGKIDSKSFAALEFNDNENQILGVLDSEYIPDSTIHEVIRHTSVLDKIDRNYPYQITHEANEIAKNDEGQMVVQKYDTENHLRENFKIGFETESVLSVSSHQESIVLEDIEREIAETPKLDQRITISDKYDQESITSDTSENEIFQSEELIQDINELDKLSEESSLTGKLIIENFESDNYDKENNALDILNQSTEVEQFIQESDEIYDVDKKNIAINYHNQDSFDSKNIVKDINEDEKLTPEIKESYKYDQKCLKSVQLHQTSEGHEISDLDSIRSDKSDQESIQSDKLDLYNYESGKLDRKISEHKNFDVENIVSEETEQLNVEIIESDISDQESIGSEKFFKEAIEYDYVHVDNISYKNSNLQSITSGNFDQGNDEYEKLDMESKSLNGSNEENAASYNSNQNNLESENFFQNENESLKFDHEILMAHISNQESYESGKNISQQGEINNVNVVNNSSGNPNIAYVSTENTFGENDNAKFDEENIESEKFYNEGIATTRLNRESPISNKSDQNNAELEELDQKENKSGHEKLVQNENESWKFDHEILMAHISNQESYESGENLSQQGEINNVNVENNASGNSNIAYTSTGNTFEEIDNTKFDEEPIESEKFDNESIATARLNQESPISNKSDQNNAELEELDQDENKSEHESFHSNEVTKKDNDNDSISDKVIFESERSDEVEEVSIPSEGSDEVEEVSIPSEGSDEVEEVSIPSENLINENFLTQQQDLENNELDKYAESYIRNDSMQQGTIAAEFEQNCIETDQLEQENKSEDQINTGDLDQTYLHFSITEKESNHSIDESYILKNNETLYSLREQTEEMNILHDSEVTPFVANITQERNTADKINLEICIEDKFDNASISSENDHKYNSVIEKNEDSFYKFEQKEELQNDYMAKCILDKLETGDISLDKGQETISFNIFERESDPEDKCESQSVTSNKSETVDNKFDESKIADNFEQPNITLPELEVKNIDSIQINYEIPLSKDNIENELETNDEEILLNKFQDDEIKSTISVKKERIGLTQDMNLLDEEEARSGRSDSSAKDIIHLVMHNDKTAGFQIVQDGNISKDIYDEELLEVDIAIDGEKMDNENNSVIKDFEDQSKLRDSEVENVNLSYSDANSEAVDSNPVHLDNTNIQSFNFGYEGSIKLSDDQTVMADNLDEQIVILKTHKDFIDYETPDLKKPFNLEIITQEFNKEECDIGLRSISQTVDIIKERDIRSNEPSAELLHAEFDVDNNEADKEITAKSKLYDVDKTIFTLDNHDSRCEMGSEITELEKHSCDNDESDTESNVSNISQRGSIPSIQSVNSMLQNVNEQQDADLYDANVNEHEFYYSNNALEAVSKYEFCTPVDIPETFEESEILALQNNSENTHALFMSDRIDGGIAGNNSQNFSYNEENSQLSFVKGEQQFPNNAPDDEAVTANFEINRYNDNGEKIEDDVVILQNDENGHWSRADQDASQTQTYEIEMKNSEFKKYSNVTEQIIKKVFVNHDDLDGSQQIKSHKFNFNEIDKNELGLIFKSTSLNKKVIDVSFDESSDNVCFTEDLVRKDELKKEELILDDIAYKVEKLQGTITQMFYGAASQPANYEETEYYQDPHSVYDGFHHDEKSEQEEGFHEDGLSTDSPGRSERDPIEHDQSSDDENLIKDRPELNVVNNESGIYDIAYDSEKYDNLSRGNTPPDKKFEEIDTSPSDTATVLVSNPYIDNIRFVENQLNPFTNFDLTNSDGNKIFGMNSNQSYEYDPAATQFSSNFEYEEVTHNSLFINVNRLESLNQNSVDHSQQDEKYSTFSAAMIPIINESELNTEKLQQNGTSYKQEEEEWGSDDSMVIHEELPDNKFPFVPDETTILKLSDSRKSDETRLKDYNILNNSIPEESENETSPSSATVTSFAY